MKKYYDIVEYDEKTKTILEESEIAIWNYRSKEDSIMKINKYMELKYRGNNILWGFKEDIELMSELNTQGEDNV